LTYSLSKTHPHVIATVGDQLALLRVAAACSG